MRVLGVIDLWGLVLVLWQLSRSKNKHRCPVGNIPEYLQPGISERSRFEMTRVADWAVAFPVATQSFSVPNRNVWCRVRDAQRLEGGWQAWMARGSLGLKYMQRLTPDARP